MTFALFLFGVLFVLCLGKLGKFLKRVIMHAFCEHFMEHHEAAANRVRTVAICTPVFAFPVLLLLQQWWLSPDAGLVLLILFRLFDVGPDERH